MSYQKAVDANVRSYQISNSFLKSKLHMSKLLLPFFNFNAGKSFLEILHASISDASVEGNIFAHSCNPLLTMCLLFELLGSVMKKFFSMSNACRTLQARTLSMIIQYIEEVDDEIFLTHAILQRDFSGRDTLRIAVELELLELIQAPKVEAIIKRLYKSDYDQSGDMFQISTSYQIVFGDKNQYPDIENDYRFYKKRDVTKVPQSEWLYEIFRVSMNAKIKAFCICATLFTIFTAFYSEVIIQIVFRYRVLNKEVDYNDLVTTNNVTQILHLIRLSDENYEAIKEDAAFLYKAF